MAPGKIGFFKALPSEMDEGLTERFTSTLAPLLPSIRESKSARYGRGEKKICKCHVQNLGHGTRIKLEFCDWCV